MEAVDRNSVTPNRRRFARTFSKVLHVRAATGVAPDDGTQKTNKFREHVKQSQERVKRDSISNRPQSFDVEKLRQKIATEAFLAKLFASISTLKSTYAQMQFAQSPYDGEGIQAADQMVVSELKNLTKLKQSYVKKRFVDEELFPEKTQVLAEIQEQKSLLKTYEIMGKKLDSQRKLKSSEIIFLQEKLEETKRENKLIEKRLNSSGMLSVPDNLPLSGLSPNHFISAVRQTVKSVRQFVRLMMNEMEFTGWDLDSAARAIEPDVVYWNENHRSFAFEAFVCREMFDGFCFPYFSPPSKYSTEQPKKQHRHFFDRFTDLKSTKTRVYLTQNPKSRFAKFCSAKYFRIVHPKMESSLFGNTNQRNSINSGEFPDTAFFAAFSEMAKKVWLLHCLAFSFEPQASIFQVGKRCRYSEVFMETVCEDAFLPSAGKSKTEPLVAFTVVPGFRIGKTVIQCQVYLS